jgi:hypothetical protein
MYGRLPVWMRRWRAKLEDFCFFNFRQPEIRQIIDIDLLLTSEKALRQSSWSHTWGFSPV